MKHLVADPDVDVVYIATPHTYHHAHALLALNAGKHVLVEKPFTMNAREAQEIFALAEAKGLVALEAMWTPLPPAHDPASARSSLRAHSDRSGRSRPATTRAFPRIPRTGSTIPPWAAERCWTSASTLISFAFDVLGTPDVASGPAPPCPPRAWTGKRQRSSSTRTDSRQSWTAPSTPPQTTGQWLSGQRGGSTLSHTWYNPTPFTWFDNAGNVLEKFDQRMTSRGMQYQAAEMERLIRAGLTAGTVLPPSESVAVMAAMDEIRRQIGLTYDADAPSSLQ
jgi:hypothetical protein